MDDSTTTTTSTSSEHESHRSGLGFGLGRLRSQSGQATAEYALVMLAAAGLAGMALAWAVSTDGVARLMDAIVDSLITQVTG